jgi:hypothetical protein
MIDDEVKDILRELIAATGAQHATIAPANGDGAGDETRIAPLGGGSELRLGGSSDGETVAVAIEHAVRALRAAARRWEAELPVVSIGEHAANAGEKVIARIQAFISALTSIQHARNACLVVDHKVMAWARTPEALDEARWPLLERRAHAAAPGEGLSSHGEVVDPDAYAVTFWYGAALLLYFSAPYGVDFVRHRARQVTRELSLLLPSLDPGPGAPAMRLPTH